MRQRMGLKTVLSFPRNILEYGSSKPWPDVLEEWTGSRKMQAGPLLEYMAPLEKWLDGEIEANGIEIGWD
jgi:peptidyl-dipeptidase A